MQVWIRKLKLVIVLMFYHYSWLPTLSKRTVDVEKYKGLCDTNSLEKQVKHLKLRILIFVSLWKGRSQWHNDLIKLVIILLTLSLHLWSMFLSSVSITCCSVTRSSSNLVSVLSPSLQSIWFIHLFRLTRRSTPRTGVAIWHMPRFWKIVTFKCNPNRMLVPRIYCCNISHGY